MLLLYVLLGILALVLLVAYLKIDTFISFVLVSIGLGLACGMKISAITQSLEKGIGGTLGSLVIIIGFGAMLGKLVADSGAAQRITATIMRVFGLKYLTWGLALAGFIIGLPLFYNAGFVIVIPLIFSIVASTRLPMLYVAIPMLSALSVAHGYLPPHPSPTAIATQFKADIGLTLFYGILVAVPAIIVAGPLFARTLKGFNPKPNPELLNIKQFADSEMPSLSVSLLVALLPLILLTAMPPIKGFFEDGTPIHQVFAFLGDPSIAMLVSVLVAVYFLGIKRGRSTQAVMKSLEEAFKGVSVILLVVAGAGGFKQILTDGGVSQYIGELLADVQISPLVLGWAIAGLIRICVGSATVAGLTTVGIVAPLVANQAIKPELMVLAIGSGSLMFSHLNDGGFWLYKEYFNLSIKETLQTWTVMETIVSVIGLIGVLILNVIV
ncbi:MAG: gluconate transporter [Cytophagia bacterium]|nr:MAG: gluconate transporter [Cytophagales bacterium]TAG38136.1 MAG: gluconate transporter [Cytophagia bacterium]TAG79568.1 MAG: gluconate transporter [Cytophagales bacterium]